MYATVYYKRQHHGSMVYLQVGTKKSSMDRSNCCVVQQCPIAPGKSFTYSFKADLYGTSWYHSHYSSQYAGGLFGSMIIHGPSNAHYDVDLGPVLLSDWYHTEYFELVKQTMSIPVRHKQAIWFFFC